MAETGSTGSGMGQSRQGQALLGALGIAAVAGIAYAATRKMRSDPDRELMSDAPRSAARGDASGNWRENRLYGRSVTVNRPRQELYAFWREFPNFPQFMENVRSVTKLDETRSHWVIEAPAGTSVEFNSWIVEDRPGELIEWTSEEGADVTNSGRIEFLDAPPGRGTIVRATIAYDPPAGAVGRLVAKALQKEPEIQARRDLKRFKQLMETGEIPTTKPGPAAPRA